MRNQACVGVHHSFNPLILHRICSSRPMKPSWRQLLWYQLPFVEWMLKSGTTDLQLVAMPMHLILSPKVNLSPMSDLDPLSLMVIVIRTATKRQTSLPVTSFAHQFRNRRLLQSRRKRQAQEMARGNLKTFTIFLRLVGIYPSERKWRGYIPY